jgi:hypothetical protein
MTQAPNVSVAGWYDDPQNPKRQRWWSGSAWTDYSRRPGLSKLTTWGAAPMLSRLIIALAGVGAVTSTLIALAALVLQRPTPRIGFLSVLAVPLVAVGQVWAIAVMQDRTPPRAFQRGAMPWNPKRFFFGELGGRISAVLLATAAAGWLLAVTAFPGLSRGGPDGSQLGCAYTLMDHGSITCVSLQAYQHAGAAEQRFTAGILMGFFCLHIGAAASAALSRRASPAPDPSQ